MIARNVDILKQEDYHDKQKYPRHRRGKHRIHLKKQNQYRAGF